MEHNEKKLPPLSAKLINNDGVIKLCEVLLKQYNREYKAAFRVNDKGQLAKLRGQLDGGFMQSILDVMKLTKEDLISRLERV